MSLAQGGFPFESLLSFRPCSYQDLMNMMMALTMKTSNSILDMKALPYHDFKKLYTLLSDILQAGHEGNR